MIYKTFFFTAFALLLAAAPGCVQEDDGSAPDRDLPALVMKDTTLTETDANEQVALTVSLSRTSNNANAVVRFAVVPGTAKSPQDYEVLTQGSLVFAPGESRKTIEILIKGDEAIEATETFEVRLYNPVNVTVEAERITVRIDDDDDNAKGLVIPAKGLTSPTRYEGYNLIWADEFDGTAVNPAFWTFETGTGTNGWGNNELQYYREDNTSIVDGHLVITAKKQRFGNSAYTSSRMVTKGKKAFKFGRIDIRAALPKGQGMWPALWMLGTNIDVVSWPACGEIDIMELTGDLPQRVLGTVHFGADVSQHRYLSQSKYLTGNDNFHDAFHVFSINWVADKIEFLVDNEVYHTITPASLNGEPYPFNKPFFFVFNVAVGGNLPGAPDATTPFPQSMIVDYVRVFQQ